MYLIKDKFAAKNKRGQGTYKHCENFSQVNKSLFTVFERLTFQELIDMTRT